MRLGNRNEAGHDQEKVRRALASVSLPEWEGNFLTGGVVQRIERSGDEMEIGLLLPPSTRAREQAIREAVQEVVSAKIEKTLHTQVNIDYRVQVDPRIQAKLGLSIGSIVAVASGKGGVGKSTVAVNLATSLALDGNRVGLLDADIYGPNVPMMFGVEEMPPPQNQKLVPAEAHGVRFMSMAFLMPSNQALIWRGPMLHKAIQQLFVDVSWGELDYLVVDLPPGTGDAQLSLAQTAPLTGGLIVTMPQNVSLADARRGAMAFQQLDVPILGVIENMSGSVFGEGGGQRAAGEMDLDFLGRVELDPAVREGGDQGTPIVVANPEAPAARSLRTIAQQVALRLNVLAAPAGPELKII